MINKLLKKIRYLYDMAIHGYDTTRNFHVSSDGKITYLDEFVKQSADVSEANLLGFPTEFAKRMNQIYNQKNLESKTEPEYQI